MDITKKEMEAIEEEVREGIKILRKSYEDTKEFVIEMNDSLKSAEEMNELETQLVLNNYKNAVVLLLNALNSTINIAEKLSARN